MLFAQMAIDLMLHIQLALQANNSYQSIQSLHLSHWFLVSEKLKKDTIPTTFAV